MSILFDFQFECLGHFLLFGATVHPFWLRKIEVTGDHERRAYVTDGALLVAFFAAEAARPTACETADCVSFHSRVRIVPSRVFVNLSFVRLSS